MNTIYSIFTAGITLEETSPEAHRHIMLAAMNLQRSNNMGLYTCERNAAHQRAADHARQASEALHESYRTGSQTVWLAVVRYAVELQVARLAAEASC